MRVDLGNTPRGNSSILFKAIVRAPIVTNEYLIRIEGCKDKRKKWRRRRNKWIERLARQMEGTQTHYRSNSP